MRVYICVNTLTNKNEAVFMFLNDAQEMLDSMKDMKDQYIIETHELIT